MGLSALSASTYVSAPSPSGGSEVGPLLNQEGEPEAKLKIVRLSASDWLPALVLPLDTNQSTNQAIIQNMSRYNHWIDQNSNRIDNGQV